MKDDDHTNRPSKGLKKRGVMDTGSGHFPDESL